MPSAAPGRMFLRQRRRRVISLPMITALLDQPRYSIADPRDPPPTPPRPAPAPKRETGKQGRPRGAMFHAERPERDPLVEALWAADRMDDPWPDLAELERR